MIFSFDVFDTCITRTYACPTDLFAELPRHLISTGITVPWMIKNNFQTLRTQAERTARRKARPREDILLNDIYDELIRMSVPADLSEKMKVAELALEEQCLHVIQPTLSKINELRDQGHKIIFISDMYLPTNFIRSILMTRDIAQEHDPVYVSGETGLTKHSGNLFKFVMTKENISASEMIHTGDNPHSDIRVPNELGIQAVLFSDSKLTHIEKKIYSSLRHSQTSQIVGTSRLSRLTNTTLSPLNTIVADVIAPFLTSFVAWVLDTAKQKGISRLYFVSRDGQILWKIAQRITKHTNGPDCRYLYGSRHAWFLPAIRAISKDKIVKLFVFDGLSKSPRDILGRLNIGVEEAFNILTKHGFQDRLDVPLAKKDQEIFCNFLLDQELSSLILDRANKTRTNALKYFAQEGLTLNDEKWALVDTGWTLKCQESLQEILNSTGDIYDIYGFYIGVRSSLVAPKLRDHYSAFVEQGTAQETLKELCDWLFSTSIVSVIENLFTIADHPTVLSYANVNGSIRPVFARESNNLRPESINPAQVHELILDYVDTAIKNELLSRCLPVLTEVALLSAQHFLTRPSKEYVACVNEIKAQFDPGHNEKLHRPLASSLSWNDIGKILLNEFGLLKSCQPDWPFWLEGSAALSTIEKRFFMMLVLSGNRFLKKKTLPSHRSERLKKTFLSMPN